MLKTRVITSLAAVTVVAIVLFAMPVIWAELLLGILIAAGAWEWSGFLGIESREVRWGYTGLVVILIAAVHVFMPEFGSLVLLVACAWWVIAFLWTLFYPTPIPAVVRWLAGLLVLVPLFVAVVTLLRTGVEYVLFILLLVWLADGGAYFAGKAFGRVKLAPEISPKKTWEGVVGGMLLVALLATAAAMIRDIDLEVLVPFGLGIGAISIVGDLTVSMFKRTAGLKDSGTLFPGHGGVLDRIDSIAAAAPLFALGLAWLGLV